MSRERERQQERERERGSEREREREDHVLSIQVHLFCSNSPTTEQLASILSPSLFPPRTYSGAAAGCFACVGPRASGWPPGSSGCRRVVAGRNVRAAAAWR